MKKYFLIIFIFILIYFYRDCYSQINVTLLGTGVPLPSIDRFGPSTLVEAGDQYFLFDCGRGASQRLWQMKIPLGKVCKIFLTDLHSDHIVGIPDLWLTGWIPANFGRRNSPMLIWGPPGTTKMMDALKIAYEWDINTRSNENNKIDSGILVNSYDINEGIVYDEQGVKITAFLVDHADFIDVALGYRIDYAGHSVVISGDTRYNKNLIKYAKGTDLLIHEVAVARSELIARSETALQILNYHTSPEEAGKVFSEVEPKLAVYYHFVLLSTDTSIPPPTIDDIIPRTKKYYSGQVELGEDLMTIDVADSVIVHRFLTDK